MHFIYFFFTYALLVSRLARSALVVATRVNRSTLQTAPRLCSIATASASAESYVCQLVEMKAPGFIQRVLSGLLVVRDMERHSP